MEYINGEEILKIKKEKNELDKLSKDIQLQQDFILSQGDKMASQNFKITESIHYAKRIQKALLPIQEELEQNWPEHFIFYKPKDIVGGDFYWTKKKANRLYVIAADCTGHGVPGAFMCMLGTTALNQIIANASEDIEASEVLNQLRENVIQTLKQRQEGSNSKDGMDLTLCIFDLKSKVLQFAGANNPVYIVRDNEVIQIKGDHMPIGRYITDSKPFSTQEFEFKSGDNIYLFSDGYCDQFDAENKFKYGAKRFRELLVEIAPLSMYEQKNRLSQSIKDWKGPLKQLDDMVVLGLRVTDEWLTKHK